MRKQKSKRPNAQKHGVFARDTIIEGEDQQEFDELHSALIDEWMPSGATEEDAVFTIAKAMWRKRREQNFLEVRMLQNLRDISHPSFDEYLGLHIFADVMSIQPGTAFEEWGSRLLRPDKINHLREKFPRSNFASDEEWAKAVIIEIFSVLAPPKTVEAPEPPDGYEEAAKLWKKSLQLKSYVLSADLFEQQIALDERLDAAIIRATKFLIQIKAMKQMLVPTSTERADAKPRLMVARRNSNERHN